ncbi:MAG: stage III sporulation protein AF [Acetobacter sp.]|nr:stage III sporulation protein AF [Bacteroides sp.]MCM1340596.1 stage III sporulation protein AF [Acetobacter sp.]MCM1433336.1 stage III sporulation protein AF [Clostridiales bacterium]
MDFIKQWTLNVCMTLITAVIFSVLSPKGNMGKYFKIIISLFITLSFILPFTNQKIDFDFSLSGIYSELKEQEQYNDTYSSLIENKVKSFLKENDYNSCIVECDVNYSNEEITIEEIIIKIPDEYNDAEVKSLVYEKLGFSAKVNYIGE